MRRDKKTERKKRLKKQNKMKGKERPHKDKSKKSSWDRAPRGLTGQEIARGAYGRGLPATPTVYVQVVVVLGIPRGDLRALAVTLELGTPSRRSCGGHCRDSSSRPQPFAHSFMEFSVLTLTHTHSNS